jgi:trans-2,3-dihydro-3-hydroxyanthranilate isomerase
MRAYQVVYIDAFTATPYTGNPCAVLPQAEGLTDEQMQAIARETNLSETAFVFPSSCADFKVRYFTPRSELPFAGHPTIATAFMLAEAGYIALEEPFTRIQLEFKIGVLPADIEVRGGRPVRVVMTQTSPTWGSAFAREDVASCFGLRDADLQPELPCQVVGTGVPFLIVPLQSLQVLGEVRQDRTALTALLDRAGVQAAFAFALGGFTPDADMHARLFDPRGTAEDPYTGSAMGALGSFVIRYGLRQGPNLTAEQGHFVGRPGKGLLEIVGEADRIESVRLGGAAVRVLEGQLFVPA